VRPVAPINSQNTVTKIIRFHTCTNTQEPGQKAAIPRYFSRSRTMWNIACPAHLFAYALICRLHL
jgi:hypothetical protein